ncbi:MAG: formyl transferase [Hyphomicrobiaceae bacterium]
MPCRIALLISAGPMGWSVANHLRRTFPDLAILVEEPETKAAILKRRARLLGWPQAVGQAACGVATKLVAKHSGAHIDRLCEDGHLDRTPLAAGSFQAVGSINSDACRAALAAINPGVVAVYGTRIIRRDTLRAVAAPFINYHAGINPKYRGQHPGYWALVNGDAAHAGVTLHLVDEGVDTGDVLYQAPVSFGPHDNITTYQWRQMIVALPLLVRSIEDGLAKRLRPYRVDLPSAQYFPPTLWGYVWNGATRGVW